MEFSVYIEKFGAVAKVECFSDDGAISVESIAPDDGHLLGADDTLSGVADIIETHISRRYPLCDHERNPVTIHISSAGWYNGWDY